MDLNLVLSNSVFYPPFKLPVMARNGRSLSSIECLFHIRNCAIAQSLSFHKMLIKLSGDKLRGSKSESKLFKITQPEVAELKFQP